MLLSFSVGFAQDLPIHGERRVEQVQQKQKFSQKAADSYCCLSRPNSRHVATSIGKREAAKEKTLYFLFYVTRKDCEGPR